MVSTLMYSVALIQGYERSEIGQQFKMKMMAILKWAIILHFKDFVKYIF